MSSSNTCNLADTDIPELDDPILDWWNVKGRKWPALAKMVKQHFAAPASSAGVERIFSAAGKMHTDLHRSRRRGRNSRALPLCFFQHRLRWCACVAEMLRGKGPPLSLACVTPCLG